MAISAKKIVQACLDAAQLLPRQGPITKFAFLNPLQGLENVHFDRVMQHVGELYGNEAYLDDKRYREKLKRKRIVEGDLREVLTEELGERGGEYVAGLARRDELRLAMLIHPFHFGQRRELDWVLAETDSLKRIRPEVPQAAKAELLQGFKQWVVNKRNPLALTFVAESLHLPIANFGQLSELNTLRAVSDPIWETIYLSLLWKVVRDGTNMGQEKLHSASVTSRANCEQGLYAHSSMGEFMAVASDSQVDALMIQFTSAFIDQGYAHATLPGVERGYWNCFKRLYSGPSPFAPRWRRNLGLVLRDLERTGLGPLESIQASLEELKISGEDSAAFIAATLLSLRGYAGMIWQSETRPDLFRRPSPPGTLIEFLAVRLVLLTLATKQSANVLSPPHRVGRNGANKTEIDTEQLAFQLFELAQVLRWSPETLLELDQSHWKDLVSELHDFGDHQRRRVFHAAYERQLAKMALRTFWVRTQQPSVRPKDTTLQVVCCIDAREESLRRNLEELDPTVETYGIAGFFGVAMYYRGAGDADFSALCPIVVMPKHWVTEEAVYSLEQTDRTRARARRFLGTAQQRFRNQSRGSVGGAIMSTLVGPLATIPMLSRILLPRITAAMNRTARQFIAPPTITRLHLERSSACSPAPPSVAEDGSINDEGVGFTLAEMSEFAERALRDIGLTSNFAPLVLLLGHGSSCINNPHESAYHCGACAGNAGGPNARALAMMLNDMRVRRCLAQNGLQIPEETQFIGGLHNTATEEMMFFDLELLPMRKVKQLRQASNLLATAARRNAHERCRRFDSASLSISNSEALLHVQNRSEDLAQTRPEYGNGSNAICFVGRRHRVRGLYLDRRSFLVSYDGTQDSADAAILARILAPVVPVCQGINLLYSFSAIDPTGWGSGTKLPHNITSLVGVMDGAASDLRPGLPWQGVDIHEPVRLLFIIEATTETLLKLMNANSTIRDIFRNHWAHLTTLDPHTNKMYRFSKDRFVLYQPEEAEKTPASLPHADCSRNWYQGKREHLPFAMIGKLSSMDTVTQPPIATEAYMPEEPPL